MVQLVCKQELVLLKITVNNLKMEASVEPASQFSLIDKYLINGNMRIVNVDRKLKDVMQTVITLNKVAIVKF